MDDEDPTLVSPSSAPEPNGAARVDRLEKRLDVLARLLADVRRTSSDALSLGRELSEGQRDLRKALAQTFENTGKIVRELAELRRVVGRWPTHPDDAGSGLAGRVAREQSNPLIVLPLPPEKGEGSASSTLPPQLKKWHKLVGAVTALVAAVAAVAAAVSDVWR